MLCDAMRIVCEQQNRRPPTHREQLASLLDGQFADAGTRDFWRAVSRLVPSRSAMSCFLRYRHMYTASVTRFTGNGSSSPGPPTPPARSQLQRRTSSGSSA